MNNADIRLRVFGDQTVPHLVVAFTKRFRPLGLGRGLPDDDDPWEHTAAWDEEFQVFNEARMWHGVVETPQQAFMQRYPAICLLAAPCPRPRDGIAWVRSVVGQGYDYSGAMSAWDKRDWQSHRRKYCAEKETLMLSWAALDVFPDPQLGIHPHELFRALLQLMGLRAPSQLSLEKP